MGRKRPELRKTLTGTSPNRHGKATEFEERWGIHVKDLARVEGISPQSIIMRVHRFGTPFQRRHKPTPWEEQYGKTIGQIAKERGIHPASVHYRMKRYGSIDLPDGTKQKPWLRDPSWSEEFEWQFCLMDTFFTLEDALARLKQLQAGDIKHEAG